MPKLVSILHYAYSLTIDTGWELRFDERPLLMGWPFQSIAIVTGNERHDSVREPLEHSALFKAAKR